MVAINELTSNSIRVACHLLSFYGIIFFLIVEAGGVYSNCGLTTYQPSNHLHFSIRCELTTVSDLDLDG